MPPAGHIPSMTCEAAKAALRLVPRCLSGHSPTWPPRRRQHPNHPSLVPIISILPAFFLNFTSFTIKEAQTLPPYNAAPTMPLQSSDFAMDMLNLSSPDSPLTTPVRTQPRWLFPSRPGWPSAILAALRPRWTTRYILCAALTLYIATCLARSQPLLSSRLPSSRSGPHAVGTIDLEVPLPSPRRISDAVHSSSGEPAFELRTTLVSLYYPTPPGLPETRPRHPWISTPIRLKAEGYAKFARINNPLTRPLFSFLLWAVAGSITIPANVDAPLLPSGPPLPVVLFSHGDASSRNDYSAYACELASRGFVVAMLEHRDGSGAATTIKVPGHPDRSIVHFSHRELHSPSSGPLDRPSWKSQQLAMRDAEVAECVSLLRAINSGIPQHNSRNEGASLPAWAGRLDLAALVLAGHSFGATSALQSLRGGPAVAGIVFDPGKSSGPLNHDIDVPVLVVHSDSWSSTRTLFYGRPHFDTVRDLVAGVMRRARASWFLTSLGTSHPSVTDFSLIQPLLLSWSTGASWDTRAALREFVRVTDDFMAFVRTGEVRRDLALQVEKDKGLLAESVTHEEYGKWVSIRRQLEFGEKADAVLWQIHVSPSADPAQVLEELPEEVELVR